MKLFMKHFLGMNLILITLILFTACAPAALLRELKKEAEEPYKDSPFAALLENTRNEESPFDELTGTISPARQRALERAREWIDESESNNEEIPVPYSIVPQPAWDNYRADCSGYISYAWELDKGETTDSLPSVATPIDMSELQPGDILLYNPSDPNKNGHVVLFVKWTDRKNGKFLAFEENGGENFGYALQRELQLEYRGGGLYIDDEGEDANGPYVPMVINKARDEEGKVKGSSDVQATIQPSEVPYKIMDQKVSPVDGKTMMFVPAGEFEMGEDAEKAFNSCQKYNAPIDYGLVEECKLEDYTDEEPIHKVYLDAFWIDKTEVTNKEYRTCMEAGVCTGSPAEDPFWRGDVPCNVEGQDCEPERYFSNPEYANHPVVGISWNEAVEYCAWAEKRLPTEAEWEKAARGTDGRTYPWGDSFKAFTANFCGESCFSPQHSDTFQDGYGNYSPVGSFPDGASPYGVLDMAGNVSEWTADWYGKDYYEASPYENPPGPENGEIRVQRGGSAHSPANELRTTRRLSQWDDGFRCVQSARYHKDG